MVTFNYHDGILVEHSIDGVRQPISESEIKRWPVALRPLKLRAVSGDTGAGDIIERTIGPLGGNAFKAWYKIIFGRECGCNTRKQHWNNRYPLKP
jgi:hypothetical protein